MFQLWGKVVKDNRLVSDIVIHDDSKDTRTSKVMNSLEKICYEMNLPKPIWFNKNIEEFRIHDKVRFTQDNFVEEIDYDCLEIEVISE